MEYREYTPSAGLRPFVRCYWTLTGAFPSSPEPQRVFPDGSMEIVFHFGESFGRVDESGVVRVQSSTLVAGQIWEPLILRPAERPDVLGVRFRPAGAASFFRFPLHHIGGHIASLEDFWGGRARSVRDAVGEARDRIAMLERCLLAMRPEPAPSLTGLSQRQYRRRFEATVGIPPKLYERIRRFQNALGRLGRMRFAQAAVEAGYYDQSHLVRDFRQFTGLTPSEWLRERDHVLFVQDALQAEALP